jgi:hypothetical protein
MIIQIHQGWLFYIYFLEIYTFIIIFDFYWFLVLIIWALNIFRIIFIHREHVDDMLTFLRLLVKINDLVWVRLFRLLYSVLVTMIHHLHLVHQVKFIVKILCASFY